MAEPHCSDWCRPACCADTSASADINATPEIEKPTSQSEEWGKWREISCSWKVRRIGCSCLFQHTSYSKCHKYSRTPDPLWLAPEHCLRTKKMTKYKHYTCWRVQGKIAMVIAMISVTRSPLKLLFGSIEIQITQSQISSENLSYLYKIGRKILSDTKWQLFNQYWHLKHLKCLR